MNFLRIADYSVPLTLPSRDGLPEQVHLFDEKSVHAINAALAARRPLLVRGEPGVGKSQLAAAAAAGLKRPLVAFTVDAATEPRELLWQFDSVKRLAEAQLCGATKADEESARQRLAEPFFVAPGPLWWGFDWHSADRHVTQVLKGKPRTIEHGADPANGRVVLIDEIDKADSDLPNGLLEALGDGRFTPRGCEEPVAMTGPTPLVVITTNEERVLPDAFLRRCLVLYLRLPERDHDLKGHLVARGRAHFGPDCDSVLQEAARQLAQDRARSTPPRPGLAEYLDLVRAVLTLAPEMDKKPEDLLGIVSEFTLRKHDK